MATKVTFDPTTKTIKFKTGVTSVDFQVDIYSDGKEDWLSSETLSKYIFPVRSIGGNVLSSGKIIEPTFFLMNGWQLEPDDANHEVSIFGNVFHDDGIPVVKVPTGYSIVVNMSTTISPDTGDPQLIKTASENQAYNGMVVIDTVNGYNGTTYPIGTKSMPAKTMADCLAIASSRGLYTLFVIGDVTLSSTDFPSYSGGTIIGQGSTNSMITINNVTFTKSTFMSCAITGTLGDGSSIEASHCKIQDLSNITINAYNCLLCGVINLNNTRDTNFYNCADGVPGSGTPIIEVGDCSNLGIWGYSGGIKLTDITTPNTNISFNAQSGRLLVDSTCVEGSIIARGVGSIVGTTGGTTINKTDLISNPSIAAEVGNIEVSGLTVEQATQLESAAKDAKMAKLNTF
jgi:hypothetical protein